MKWYRIVDEWILLTAIEINRATSSILYEHWGAVVQDLALVVDLNTAADVPTVGWVVGGAVPLRGADAALVGVLRLEGFAFPKRHAVYFTRFQIRYRVLAC